MSCSTDGGGGCNAKIKAGNMISVEFPESGARKQRFSRRAPSHEWNRGQRLLWDLPADHL